MDINTAIRGLLDAESKLSNADTMNSRMLISENLYRLGQYASALEKHLGDAEEEYEKKWAETYNTHKKTLSATAAENQANVDCAADKGNIKRLSRYVSSSWRIYTGAMARVNHLTQESQSMRGQT